MQCQRAINITGISSEASTSRHPVNYLGCVVFPSSAVFLKLRGLHGQVPYPNEPLLYPLAVNVCRNGNVHECKLYKYISAGHTMESLKN